MKKHFHVNLSFQIMVIITFGLIVTALIQSVYSKRIVEKSILDGTKKQAYIYLLGLEKQIQSLKDPFNQADLKQIFHSIRLHDASSLNFDIINIYMYDRLGKVITSLREPQAMFKDLDSKYGRIFHSQKPYLDAEIEDHHSSSQGKPIRSTDVLIPVHFNDNIIGGLEVEIDLDKTFTHVKQMNTQYEFQISVILCAVILILIASIWFIIKFRIIRPVQKIGQVTRRIAEGNLKAKVNLESADEIGGLAESVNKMAYKLEKLYNQLDETYMGTLASVTRALEAKDNYTANHSANVTKYSLEFGHHLGLSNEELDILKQGAMVHDLGKIGIPDDILKKSDGLNGIERDIIQQHPPLTSAILDPLKKIKHFSDIARYHHERWDGKGYPDGLTGENIPFLARIVSITDSWDAMTSDRVYRKGMDKEQALQILEQERDNGQWDPCLVDQFVILLRENSQYDLPPVDIAA